MLGPRPTIHWGSQPTHLSTLFFVECTLIPIAPALNCSRKNIYKLLGVLQSMQGSSGVPSTTSSSIIESAERLKLCLADLDSYSDNVTALQQRCTGLAQLFDRLLTFEQSQIAHAQNSKMTLLTEKTTDDSLTVRSITVVSLIYLSFTVVAVSFPRTSRTRLQY
jgi:hypothetical protein